MAGTGIDLDSFRHTPNLKRSRSKPMSRIPENNPIAIQSSGQPILRINRLNHVRMNAKILDSTDQKLKQYLEFAAARMDTEVSADDVIEFALNLLFDRDSAFRSWLKRKS